MEKRLENAQWLVFSVELKWQKLYATKCTHSSCNFERNWLLRCRLILNDRSEDAELSSVFKSFISEL